MHQPLSARTPLALPWFWAPYVIYLGLLDWLKETGQVTHAQVLEEGVASLKRDRHRIFRVVSSAILIGALALLFIQRSLAPWLSSGGLAPSPSELLWGSLLLAVASVLTIPYLILRKLLRGLCALYARGLGVLAARQLNP